METTSVFSVLLIDTWTGLRLVSILMAFLYFLFSLLVVTEVDRMTETVETDSKGVLRNLALANVALAVFVTVLFIGFFFDASQILYFLHLSGKR